MLHTWGSARWTGIAKQPIETLRGGAQSSDVSKFVKDDEPGRGIMMLRGHDSQGTNAEGVYVEELTRTVRWRRHQLLAFA